MMPDVSERAFEEVFERALPQHGLDTCSDATAMHETARNFYVRSGPGSVRLGHAGADEYERTRFASV
jgi:hypothetical protein